MECLERFIDGSGNIFFTFNVSLLIAGELVRSWRGIVTSVLDFLVVLVAQDFLLMENMDLTMKKLQMLMMMAGRPLTKMNTIHDLTYDSKYS